MRINHRDFLIKQKRTSQDKKNKGENIMEEEKFVKFGYIVKDKDMFPTNNASAIAPGRPFREVGRINQLEWIKKILEYIQLASTYELRYDLKMGEIYEIDFGINVNSEFSNRHYGVVLVDSGPKNPLVMVCPLKTNHSGGHRRSDVVLGVVEDLSETAETIAVINQVRTIDKFRILRKNQIGIKKVPINIYEDDEPEEISEPIVKRLNQKQLIMVRNAFLNFVELNGIMIPAAESDQNN